MTQLHSPEAIIGRAELLDFVDYAVVGVPAKVDTGAYTSAVHAESVRLSDDAKTLEFRLLGGHPLCDKLAATIATHEFSKIMVSNSFGHSQERFVVRLHVKIGPKIFTTDFTLADRSKKVYPILLGRKALTNRFLVNTALSQVDRVALKRQFGIDFPVDEEE